MNVKLLFLLALVALSSFFYLYVENPGDLTIVIARGHSYTLPVVLVLVISFLMGVFMMGIDSVISDAMRTMRENRARRAAKALEEARRSYARGLEAMAREDYGAAREHMERALKTLRGEVSVLLSLAEVHMLEGHPSEAVEVLESELFHNPSSVTLLTALGRYARKAGDLERASRAFEEVLKKEKDNPFALRSLRDIRIEEEEWARAMELEKRILEGKKKGWLRGGGREAGRLPALLYELGRERFRDGDMDGAEKALSEALRRDEAFVPAVVLFGEVYGKKYGSYEALMVWEKGYSMAPGCAALLMRMEDYHVESSTPEKMIEFYKREMEKRPEDANIVLLLSRFYLRVEMAERAVDELERLRGQGRESRYSRVLLATAYQRLGYDARAAETFSRALGIEGEEARPNFTCTSCSTTFDRWDGRCGLCGEWNTLEMNPEAGG